MNKWWLLLFLPFPALAGTPEQAKVEAGLAKNVEAINDLCKSAIDVSSTWEGLLPKDLPAAGQMSGRCEAQFMTAFAERCKAPARRTAIGTRLKRIHCRYHSSKEAGLELDKDVLVVVTPLSGDLGPALISGTAKIKQIFP